MRRMRSRRSSFFMASSAMTDFMRQSSSPTKSNSQIFRPASPLTRKVSRQAGRVAALKACLRLTLYRTSSRLSSRTTATLRMADSRPLPRGSFLGLSGRHAGSLRGPGRRLSVGRHVDSPSLKSVSNEIVPRETEYEHLHNQWNLLLRVDSFWQRPLFCRVLASQRLPGRNCSTTESGCLYLKFNRNHSSSLGARQGKAKMSVASM